MVDTPKSPKKAKEADLADPGKMNEVKAKQTKENNEKLGSVKVNDQSNKGQSQKQDTQEKEKKTWLEFKIFDAAGDPVKDAEKCKLTLKEKGKETIKTLSTRNGLIRLEKLESECEVKIQLVDRYDEEWIYQPSAKPTKP